MALAAEARLIFESCITFSVAVFGAVKISVGRYSCRILSDTLGPLFIFPSQLQSPFRVPPTYMSSFFAHIPLPTKQGSSSLYGLDFLSLVHQVFYGNFFQCCPTFS